MNTKTELRLENVCFEMEYRGENEDGTYEDIIVRKQSPQERLGEKREEPHKYSGEVKFRYFLVAVTVIAVASFLTAAATLVLALALTMSRNNASTSRDSINPSSEMSEIKKNLQELKKNFSALRESSVSKNLRELEVALADTKRELENVKSKGENTAELWFFLNGTVHKNFLDFKRQIVQLDQKGENTKELGLFLNGTVHDKFFDFQKQIVELDQEITRLTRDAFECILPTQHIGRSAYTNMEDGDLQMTCVKENFIRVKTAVETKVKNVSKMPGPIGPPGHSGSQGPAGRNGSSDFSTCQLRTKAESMTPGTNRILVHLDEPANQKVIAVTCSTDYNSEYNLLSTVQGGVRRYVCTCNGKSTLFTRGTSCYLNYWICPLTT